MRRQPVAVEVYMDVTFTRFDEAEHIVVILMRIVDRGMPSAENTRRCMPVSEISEALCLGSFFIGIYKKEKPPII